MQVHAVAARADFYRKAPAPADIFMTNAVADAALQALRQAGYRAACIGEVTDEDRRVHIETGLAASC